MKSSEPLKVLASSNSDDLLEPFTFVFVRQILFSFNHARFCLNLRGRRRCGSPATTSVDPTKSLNLEAAVSLVSDSPATRSMNNFSKFFFLICDSPATRSKNPTLFSNLVMAWLIGTLVSSSCIQVLGVPVPASTKNLSSPKHNSFSLNDATLFFVFTTRATTLSAEPSSSDSTCNLNDGLRCRFEVHKTTSFFTSSPIFTLTCSFSSVLSLFAFSLSESCSILLRRV
ncbi:unnamed protein product [Trifolium pratense]|uniref:Uncharacterized protein n=1 Tax=Trifolium pratense TaxID=57577 RepID=A0ACB0LVT8_TRIPR|nr:unnamed protein product [Trifolium pratense]